MPGAPPAGGSAPAPPPPMAPTVAPPHVMSHAGAPPETNNNVSNNNNRLLNDIARALIGAHGAASEAAQRVEVSASAGRKAPPVRINVPPLPVWDGKDSTRRTTTFLSDVERYASMSGQDALDLFTTHLDPTFREAFGQVRRQHAAQVTAMTWEQAKAEFPALTGEVYERTTE